MLSSSLVIAATGLAAAQAFLLVPGFTAPGAPIVKAISFEPPKIAETRIVEVTCPGCPLQFVNRNGEVKVKTDKPSHLELSFAVEIEGESDRLLVNGFEIYPGADPFAHALTAPHKPDHLRKKHHGGGGKHQDGRPRHEFGSPQLGFSLAVKPVAKDADQLELVHIDLQILEVANSMVAGIPGVHVELIKTPQGKLMIADLSTTPSQSLQATPMDNQSECTTLLCKWLAIVHDKMSKMRASKHCGGKGAKAKAAAVAAAASASAGRPHHRPHYSGGHGHDSGYTRKHTWAQLFRSVASHILLPVLIGIVAGISVSLVGMMVGTVIVTLWRVFIRRQHHRRHAGHACRRSLQNEASVEDEKSGLMEHQGPPPSYEEEDAKKAEAEA
jgi:hypothetical protein